MAAMIPQTPAGRALLERYRVEGSPMKATVNLVNGILAIEREAAAAERERLIRQIEERDPDYWNAGTILAILAEPERPNEDAVRRLHR